MRNAWQHCQKHEGSITIAARAGYMGDAVICELSDDGPGVPAEYRAHIFEPFFTTRPGGTGLGLYIARELADANGAALELLPQGTRRQLPDDIQARGDAPIVDIALRMAAGVRLGALQETGPRTDAACDRRITRNP